MRKCAVGGQAVMEGVMMKSDKGIAMAVRRADGKIVASYKNQVSKAQKGTFWGLPIIRGVVALVESLTTGMSTTMDSAKMYRISSQNLSFETRLISFPSMTFWGF